MTATELISTVRELKELKLMAFRGWRNNRQVSFTRSTYR